ncbi:MAG: hypothetical protein Q6373_000375 [Candidatus Sigynarchaeota archaeon]
MIGEQNKPQLTAPFLKGHLVYLQPHDEKDIPPFLVWVNDPECRHYSRNMMPQTLDSEKKWLVDNSTYSQ